MTYLEESISANMVHPQTNEELAPQFEEYLLAKSVGEKRVKFYLHVFNEVSTFVRDELMLDCSVESFEAFFEEKIGQGLSLGRQKAYREVLEEILAFQEDYAEWIEPSTLSNPAVDVHAGTSPGMPKARPSSYSTSPGMRSARRPPTPGLSMEDLPSPASYDTADFDDAPEEDMAFEPTAVSNLSHMASEIAYEDLPAAVPSRVPSGPVPPPSGAFEGYDDLPARPRSGGVADFLQPTSFDDEPDEPFPLLEDEDEDEDAGVWELPDLPDDEELDLLESHRPSRGEFDEGIGMGGAARGPAFEMPPEDEFDDFGLDMGGASAGPLPGEDFGDFGDAVHDFSAPDEGVREPAPLGEPFSELGADEGGLDFSRAAPAPKPGGVARPRSEEPLDISADAVIAVVSNELELDGTGEAERIQEFFQSEQTGSAGQGEAVAFSRLSSLSPGFGLPGAERMGDSELISSDDLFGDAEEDDLDFGPPQFDEGRSGSKKRGPSLRSVSVPDHVVESAKPRKVGAGDVDTLKRFTKNLDVRTSKPGHHTVTRKKIGFLYEETYHVPIKTPKPRNFEPVSAGNLVPGALKGLLLPVLIPALVCLAVAGVGVSLGVTSLGAILMGTGFMGALGFVGLGVYFMKRSAAPIRRQTPNAVFDSYISALRYRNWSAARACLASPLTEGSDFNVAKPPEQIARWSELIKKHRMSRFHSHPVGVVRRAGGAEDSGAVILISILVPEQQYIVVPAVRLKDGWYLTDGELCIRQVGESMP